MKKWNNPELKDLSIGNTNEGIEPYTHVPVPDWDCSTKYDPFDRETCRYWKVNGCSHDDWGTGCFSQFKWPCPKATTTPTAPIS